MVKTAPMRRSLESVHFNVNRTERPRLCRQSLIRIVTKNDGIDLFYYTNIKEHDVRLFKVVYFCFGQILTVLVVVSYCAVITAGM